MKHVFYLMTIAAIWWEACGIADTKRIHKFCMGYKGKSFDIMTPHEKMFTFLMAFYVLWALIGLFSFQWPVFIGLIALSFIPKKNIAIRWVDSLLTFVLLVFIIINAYHLKLNVLDIIF